MKNGKGLRDKAIAAMRKAIRGVVARHKKSGEPLAVWKNGKVTYIPARSLR